MSTLNLTSRYKGDIKKLQDTLASKAIFYGLKGQNIGLSVHSEIAFDPHQAMRLAFQAIAKWLLMPLATITIHTIHIP